MAFAVGARTLVQMGAEDPKGTPVPATEFAMFPRIQFVGEDETVNLDIANGVVAEASGEILDIFRGTTFNIDAPLHVEQLVHLLAAGIEAPAAPTTPGGTAPRLWSFDRPNTVVPDPKAFTYEMRLDDGTSQLDVEFPYCLASGLSITGARDTPMRMGASMFGRRRNDSTFTPALPAIDIDGFSSNAAVLALADSWADLVGQTGTWAELSDDITAVDFQYRTGYEASRSISGRVDLDFKEHIFNPRNNGFTFTASGLVTLDPTDLYLRMQAAAEASGRVFMHLKCKGPEIEPGFNKEVNIYMAGRNAPGTVLPGAEDRGQESFDIELITYPEAIGGGGTWLLVEVQNDRDGLDIIA